MVPADRNFYKFLLMWLVN